MIEYDRLLQLARKMYHWIFLHTTDNSIYEELEITDEEDALLTYWEKVAIDPNEKLVDDIKHNMKLYRGIISAINESLKET